ncbi:MAG: conjugative transfer system coupling protein TraD [Magnetococcales bacterium]|nr:conjugative transfer system coupling protein TraD [Magnetococcales bacterium]NGZ28001.1 conjugative transfer system coupling protein TraD [Magnetococcales bacterium]
MTSYDRYVRPPWEWIMCGAWSLVALCGLGGVWWFPGGNVFWSIAIPAMLLAMWGGWKGLAVIRYGDASLDLWFLDVAGLPRTTDGGIWFGKGFEWRPVHTQRSVEIMKSGGVEQKVDVVGSSWIHGVNGGMEQDIILPEKALEGHTVIFGTTGAGKTRAFEVVVTQAIHHGYAIIVIDPKGDTDLRDRLRRECDRSGRTDSFIYLHPALPNSSMRLDPIHNWKDATELGSRIAALMPSSGNSAAFAAFGFKVITAISQGLILLGERPTLRRLRYFVESGVDLLTLKCLEVHCDRVAPGWRGGVESFIKGARNDEGKTVPAKMGELFGIIRWYRATLGGTARGHEGIDGLISLVEHDRTHFGKMVATLIPLLAKITSGEIGTLLSPDFHDLQDARPIMDMAKLVAGRHVAYICLDSLSNSEVGAALGSILLADIGALAGAIYNSSEQPSKPAKVLVLVDEAAEVVNDPFIQLLNKGRGAGFRVVMAAQTLPDFIARTGDPARAMQILGNCNNMVALRIKDSDTMDFIAKTFGQAHIQEINLTQGGTGKAGDGAVNFTGSASRSLGYTETELFPPYLLGRLPNFHYVASISGGVVVKGRLPLLTS